MLFAAGVVVLRRHLGGQREMRKLDMMAMVAFFLFQVEAVYLE
jgi:hypothetical protein